MNVLGLCSGAGGLDLGVRIAVPHARSVAYVEREAYAAATLVARMEDKILDDAPVWSDLATFDAGAWRGAVDCVISGDPCQPNSVAGKRGGADDDRWLIERVLDIFEASGAGCFFRENVPGNADGQLAAIVPALERLGCRVASGIFSASEAGGSHRRERLFIMADRRGLSVGRTASAGEKEGGRACGALTGRGGDGLGNTERAERRAGEPAGHQPDRHDPGRAKETGGAGKPDQGLGNAASPRHGGWRPGPGGPVRNQGGRAQPGRRGPGMADTGGVDAQGLRPGDGSQGRQNARRPAGLCSRADLADAKGDLRRSSGDDGHSAPDRPGDQISAPGPASPGWPAILDADPLAAPAIGTIDLWAIARANLGLPALEPDTWNSYGGMARGMDQAAVTAAQSMVRGMADGLAPRADRLRACGNGVFPLAAALAWVSLDARLREGR